MWSKGGWIKVTATTIPIEWLETEPEDPSIKEKLEKIINDKHIQKILGVLTEVDEATAYYIEKRTGMPHATIHKKIKQALK